MIKVIFTIRPGFLIKENNGVYMEKGMILLSTEELYTHIIENFKAQHHLYQNMADLSQQQLDLLKQNNGVGDDLMMLLEQRQEMVAQIDDLNGHNRQAQQQITASLGLDEFVLSGLAEKLNAHRVQALQEILQALGQLMADISELDRQSNNLIRKKISDRKNNMNRRGTQVVQQAYKEMMMQTKKPEES
ncbi:MAG: flagellar export chaperone FlgN [Syntrophomonas sp.]|nr:flagellar export chaperone FlgN [Syntrophomonas sp.]